MCCSNYSCHRYKSLCRCICHRCRNCNSCGGDASSVAIDLIVSVALDFRYKCALNSQRPRFKDVIEPRIQPSLYLPIRAQRKALEFEDVYPPTLKIPHRKVVNPSQGEGFLDIVKSDCSIM